jgi:hypothetical protein
MWKKHRLEHSGSGGKRAIRLRHSIMMAWKDGMERRDGRKGWKEGMEGRNGRKERK